MHPGSITDTSHKEIKSLSINSKAKPFLLGRELANEAHPYGDVMPCHAGHSGNNAFVKFRSVGPLPSFQEFLVHTEQVGGKITLVGTSKKISI